MAVFTAIGAAIFGAGTFAALATAAALQIATGIAVNLIAKSIAGDDSAQQNSGFGVNGKLQAGGTIPRSMMLGYGATAGSLVYANTWGVSGQYDSAYMTQVICVSDLPVDSLAEVWVNGELVTLDASPHASRGYPVLEYRKDGTDHLWIKFYDGTQTAADTFLTGTVSSTERPYLSTRIGYGCPYVVATALVNETLWRSGFPSFKFALNGVKLYDISKDSTAGGSGSHRWATPATWGGDGDKLPAVQAYNLLRGFTYGGLWFYGLQNLPAARLPSDHWVAQIEKCRALIDGPDGDEATYRSGGEIGINAPIADAMEALLTSCQGRLPEIGGTYKIYVGEPDAAVFTFDDGDILSSEEQSFTPFFGLSDTINGISARHPSPAEGWNQKVAPPLYNDTFEHEDGDRQLMADVSLDLVPYPGQVQRLMKSALAEGRRARRHTFVLPPDAFPLEPGDTIEWSSVRNGYTSKTFRVDGMIDLANLDLMVDITEVDTADYAWNQGTDFTTPVDGPLLVVRPAPQPIVDWDVVAETVLDSDDNARRPSMRISWDGAQPDVRAVAFQVRLTASGETVYAAEVSDVAASTALLPPVFLPNTEYEARGRYVPISQRDTVFSSWLPVTTDDVRLSSLDVDLTSVSTEVQASLLYLRQFASQAKDLLERTGSLIAEQDFANYGDKKQLRREIVSLTGEIEAGYLEAIEVATGTGSAIATAIESLYVAMGGNTAAVNIVWEALAAPSGYAARYGITASVDDGAYRSASLLLDVPTNPASPSRIVLDAGQVVITSDAGATLAALFSAGTTYLDIARIQDATITGAKIANATIGSAQIGTAAITSAKIGDLEVSTIKIADAAVNAVYSAGTLTTGSINWTSPYTATFNAAVSNTPVVVAALVDVIVPGSGSSNVVYIITLTGNGVTLGTTTGSGLSSGSRLTVPLSAVSVPGPSGTYTYTLTVSLSNFSGTATTTAYYCGIVGTVAKK